MYDISNALASVEAASSIEELANSIDYLPSKKLNKVTYGLEQGTKKKRLDANREAKEILNRVGTNHSLLSDEDREKLRAYSGLGGIGGSVHEYYTPQYIAEGVWNSLKVNGFENGNVGEPSAGAGVFNAVSSVLFLLCRVASP